MIEILGKLHPALVHLPIGFILITLFYEWYKGKPSVALWGISTLSAILAMATGFILLKTGYFEGLNMFLHMIMGVITTIITFLLFLAKMRDGSLFRGQNTFLKIALIAVLGIGGHMGAELTHGEEYLPLPFQTKSDSIVDFSKHDTIILYDHIIQPILKDKCNRCHEDGDARGKLNMTSKEGLLSDKFGDPAVKPGDLQNSEIFKRISLSPWHKKYMPPSGPDLTYGEKRVIEWWIRSGGSFTENVKMMSPPDDIKELLFKEYGIDFAKKSFYEKAEVSALDQSVIDKIKSQGFNIGTLADNSNFVDVNVKGHSLEWTSERLQSLLEAKIQITWLDLSDSDFDDSHSDILNSFPNITKLKLQNTNITDATLENIVNMNELIVLNLYGTNASDQSIDNILKINKLEKLYIWQTKISEEGIERLKQGNSALEVIGASIL